MAACFQHQDFLLKGSFLQVCSYPFPSKQPFPFPLKPFPFPCFLSLLLFCLFLLSFCFLSCKLFHISHFVFCGFFILLLTAILFLCSLSRSFFFCLFCLGFFNFYMTTFLFLFITCKLTHFQPSKRYPLTVKWNFSCSHQSHHKFETQELHLFVILLPPLSSIWC